MILTRRSPKQPTESVLVKALRATAPIWELKAQISPKSSQCPLTTRPPCASVGSVTRLPSSPCLGAQKATHSGAKCFLFLSKCCLTPALFRQISRYRELKAPMSNPHGFLQVRLNIQSYSFLQPFYFYFFPAAFSVLLSNVPKNHFHSSSFRPPDFTAVDLWDTRTIPS